jgi:uncharacterized protein YdhG (YjbR/CyaY superfamily)
MEEMASKKPTTIAEYIQAAPDEGQVHLHQLYAILKSVAPEAEEAIKWGTPFFVEPRFVFAFSAHKAHLSFAPTAAALEQFRKELEQHKRPKTSFRFRTTNHCQKHFARSPITVSSLYVNAKMMPSGNSSRQVKFGQIKRKV